MKWERTFEFSAPVEKVWQAFTDKDVEVRMINADNAYLAGGAVKMEFTKIEENSALEWTETEGDYRWDMAVTFASTDTGSKITIVRSGFGDDDGWLMRANGRFLGWEEMLHDLEVYFRTGTFLRRLYTRGWGRTGMQVVEAMGGLRVSEVFPGQLAANAGLEVGDILVRAGGVPLFRMSDHWQLETSLQPDVELEFEFVRGSELRTGTARVPAPVNA